MKKAWPMAIAIVLGGLTSLPCGAAEEAITEERKDPVGYWKFDEGEGTVVNDASGNNYHGLILKDGKHTRWVDGRNGKAIEFLGKRKTRNENGCVRIPLMGEYDFSKGITFDAWVKFNTVDTRGARFGLVTNARYNDSGPGFHIFFAWGGLYFRTGEGPGKKVCDTRSNRSQTKFEADLWYHIAVTYDGSVVTLYLDGKEIAASEPGVSLSKGRNEFYIGSTANGYAYGMEGIIDEVRLYDHARSPMQILKAAKFAR